MTRTLTTVGFSILTFPLIALQGVTKGREASKPRTYLINPSRPGLLCFGALLLGLPVIPLDSLHKRIS
jgi:hypothetical protein